MRFGLILVMALSVAACGSGGIPATSPSPPAPPPAAPPPVPDPPAPPSPAPIPDVTGILWVMVFPEGGSGICLPEATVQAIVEGTVVQSGTQTPCDYWGYDGGVLFKNLPVREVTLRASAPGYRTGEITATPSTGMYQATPITLSQAK